MQALITVYIDSEKTDYYGKFSYRYASANIMEYIFNNDTYRKKFVELSSKHEEDFHEFCNLLINDMNTMLLDGLIALEEIKNFEDMQADAQRWGTLSEEQKEQAESNYKDQSRKAKGTLQLSNMVIQLLNLVTTHCQEPFISEELGEKFATALNYSLDHLVRRGVNYKIKNPERFHFEPRGLLVNVVTMYGNMSRLEDFRKNVVADKRSYSDETFEKTLKILTSVKRNVSIGGEVIQKFEALLAQLKQQKEIAAQHEVSMLFLIKNLHLLTLLFYLFQINLDDAPDEYLDPLTFELMNDPVELPDSKTVIDRLTISKCPTIIPSNDFLIYRETST